MSLHNTLDLKFPKFARLMVARRFFKYLVIKRARECWEWTGGTDGDGYGCFRWTEKNIQRANQAAYELFVGKRHGLQVLHTCDNPSCCNPEHLFLGTSKDNFDDMVRKGRRVIAKGEVHGSSKLTYKDVRRIKKLLKKGKHTQKRIAKKFGVKQSQISLIKSGKTWGYIK